MKLLLASRSPRRIEMLSALGAELEILPADIDEEAFGQDATPAELVRILAREKALAAARHCPNSPHPIVSADTVVDLDGRVLGKPKDTEDARQMLRALSGREHQVHTGVAVLLGGKLLSETVSSTVHFRPLTKDEIDRYIACKEPMDKAGAYGIQGFGGLFVDEIKGDYHAVVGLPLERLNALLIQLQTPGLLPL